MICESLFPEAMGQETERHYTHPLEGTSQAYRGKSRSPAFDINRFNLYIGSRVPVPQAFLSIKLKEKVMVH